MCIHIIGRGVEIVKKNTCPKEQISLYLTVFKQIIISKQYEKSRYISTLVSMDPDQQASLENSVDPDQLASEEAS